MPMLQECSYLGPVHIGSQALTHVTESQHGGKVPTFEPQGTIEISIKVGSWLFYEKGFVGLVLRIGPSFCSTQLSTQVPSPHLQKCCHAGIYVILGS
jgi:hypothetical protein